MVHHLYSRGSWQLVDVSSVFMSTVVVSTTFWVLVLLFDALHMSKWRVWRCEKENWAEGWGLAHSVEVKLGLITWRANPGLMFMVQCCVYFVVNNAEVELVVTLIRPPLQTLPSPKKNEHIFCSEKCVTTFEEMDGAKLSGFQTAFQTGSSPNIQVGLAWGVILWEY